jgi:L-ascorbate metabolism protein UlaG (beta-lactamase superfamily)
VNRENEGLWGWKQRENNNRLLAFQVQRGSPTAPGRVIIDYFGSSAFRITSPMGVTVLIDPWRNHPGGGVWYLHEMPPLVVDIGLSTHAHMDHDALHLLHANMLLDRMVGRFQLADLAIVGIADKHAWNSSTCIFDWARTVRASGIELEPPNNVRAFDNTVFVVETGGLRIAHWGDNRPDAGDAIWAALDGVDVLLLPVDGSRHILSYEQADAIVQRTRARICIPHHYLVASLLRPASTLLPADEWVARHPHTLLHTGSLALTPKHAGACAGKVFYFGDHLAHAFPAPRATLLSGIDVPPAVTLG